MKAERRRGEAAGVEVAAGADDQVLMGADRLAAAEHRGDALLGPQSVVVALQELPPLRFGELRGGLPAAVGDLVPGPVTEADGGRAGRIDVGHERVAGGGPVRVQQAVELCCGLGGEAAPELAVGADPAQPFGCRGLVGEGPRPDHGRAGQR